MTLWSILQKPNKTHLQSALIRNYMMKSGRLTSARAHLECVLSLHDSVYYLFKIRGQKMYIFISIHLVNLSYEECRFFLKKSQHGYKCDIDFIQQFNKQ